MIKYLEVIFKDLKENLEYEELARKVISKCFEVENINSSSFYISVTLTTPENIKEINQEFRQVDRATDVLSFPMYEKDELDKIVKENTTFNFQEVMGDIIISIPKVYEQAEEYGHGFEREFAYMLVHGFYHLRGYDHMVEEEKVVMRQKEENVLNKLEIFR